MKYWKKITLALLAMLTCSITLYAYAVTHPTNALSHKACTSWDIVKRKAFELSHTDFSNQPALDRSTFRVERGTATEVPVLMYHYIEPKLNNHETGNKSIINLEDFEQNMKYLHDEGYRTITLDQLEQYVSGKISLPQKSIVITFDDGYHNNYTLAYPVLQKYNFHASLFVIGSKIQDQPSEFDPAKKVSSPDQRCRPQLTYLNLTAIPITCITRDLCAVATAYLSVWTPVFWMMISSI